jgi:hypothetical protein
MEYLQFLFIEDDGKVAYLNGDKSLSFQLPAIWFNTIELYGPVIAACDKYGKDYG